MQIETQIYDIKILNFQLCLSRNSISLRAYKYKYSIVTNII